MKYFAYGSNMSSKRLKEPRRIPGATTICRAVLPMHKLMFHKLSKRDKSGKCDAYYTDSAEDQVFGVLYEVDQHDMGRLDRVEGCGHGYRRRGVTVSTDSGDHEAVTYLANDSHIDSNLTPYTWYKQHVLIGAQEHGLPAHYIEMIDRVNATRDADRQRETDELSIYS